jgi:hypothetical protein
MADLETSHATLDHTGLTGVGGTNAVTQNEIRNFPSIEFADGAQPEWWEESAGTATLTEEDVAGESITESWDRCLKVVTTADVYAYQQFTYADEQRLKAGKVVSARVAVWSVSGVTARVRIQDSGGSLGVATTTAAAWTILTVENKTLTGTNVQLRLEVNNGTAYFVPLAFGIGTSAPAELRGRGLRYIDKAAEALNTTGVADPNVYTDLDLTSVTSNLAAVASVYFNVLHGATATGWDIFARRKGASTDFLVAALPNFTATSLAFRVINDATIGMDDGQNIQYKIDRWTGSGTMDIAIGVRGWWEWA